MTTINLFMLFREIITVFVRIVRNPERHFVCKLQLLTVKASGTFRYHWTRKGCFCKVNFNITHLPISDSSPKKSRTTFCMHSCFPSSPTCLMCDEAHHYEHVNKPWRPATQSYRWWHSWDRFPTGVGIPSAITGSRPALRPVEPLSSVCLRLRGLYQPVLLLKLVIPPCW
jgi:hypothetical protein